MSQLPDPQSFGDQPLTPIQEIYRENILDHYRDPHHHGLFETADISEQGHNPICGDELGISLQLGENNTVSDICWTGHGCAISQASMSMLSDQLIGMPLANVLKLDKQTVFDMLGIPVGPARMKCALLSLRTVQKGIMKHLTPPV